MLVHLPFVEKDLSVQIEANYLIHMPIFSVFRYEIFDLN